MRHWHRGGVVFATIALLAAAFCVCPLRFANAETVATERAAAAATWPFDPPPLETLRQSPRKIFAHWHVWPISMDNQPADNDAWTRELMRPEGEGGKNAAGGGFSRERPLPRPVIAGGDWRVRDMETEVRRASALGLDGFIFNITAPPPHRNFERLPEMLEAAQRVDPGFRVALMIDAAANRDSSPDELAAAVLQMASHPSVYHTADGRLVVMAFAADNRPIDWWQQLLGKLKDAGVSTFFMPVFLNWQRSLPPFLSISEGASDWGNRTPSAAARLMPAAAEMHALGKIWMAPVTPQLFRPKKDDLFYKEAVGSATFRETWRVAIEGGADWVQLVTWNDYGEATDIAPSTGIQYAFYDLSAYYGTWFKTGQQPPISRDVLYYFHRIMPAATPPDLSRQARPFAVREGEPPQDIIELLAFLTEPGTLEIEIGGKTYKQEAPAGITSFRAPLAPGRPRFRLVRNDTAVIDFASAFDVRTKVEFQDFLYRAGSSSRPPVEMVANPPPAQ